MLAMIPSTRFRPSSISLFSLCLCFDGQDIQKRPLAFAFQSLHSTIKSRRYLAIHARCDFTDLNGAAKFIERLTDDLPSVLRIARLVFVIDRELLAFQSSQARSKSPSRLASFATERRAARSVSIGKKDAIDLS